MPNQTNNSKPTKKPWSKPDFSIISSADDVINGGGPRANIHEANFTPNHTQIFPLGNPANKIPINATKFFTYVS